MTITQNAMKDRAATLGAVKKMVRKYMVNPYHVDLDEWACQVDHRLPELLPTDESSFENGVRDLLKLLRVSHTNFYKDLPDRFPPQHTINATLRRLDSCQWMFLDVFDRGPAEQAGIRPGDLLESVDGVDAMGSSLPGFGIGRQHRLCVTKVDGSDRREMTVNVPARKSSKAAPPIVEPMALKSSVIQSRIGFLKIAWFPGSLGLDFAKELDRAIRKIRSHGTDRLIVDLRGNIGGGLGFARLASYFCPGSIAIGQSVTPQRQRTGLTEELPRVPMPATKWELLRTLARFAVKDKSLVLLTQGLGSQAFHGRIVILVNEWTNSAGEMVANFAAENRLATVVGVRTAGNVLGARNFKVGRNHWLRIPIFGWLTRNGKSLDGTGLEPDIHIDVDPARLNAGEDQQLDRGIQILN